MIKKIQYAILTIILTSHYAVAEEGIAATKNIERSSSEQRLHGSELSL